MYRAVGQTAQEKAGIKFKGPTYDYEYVVSRGGLTSYTGPEDGAYAALQASLSMPPVPGSTTEIEVKRCRLNWTGATSPRYFGCSTICLYQNVNDRWTAAYCDLSGRFGGGMAVPSGRPSGTAPPVYGPATYGPSMDTSESPSIEPMSPPELRPGFLQQHKLLIGGGVVIGTLLLLKLLR